MLNKMNWKKHSNCFTTWLNTLAAAILFCIAGCTPAPGKTDEKLTVSCGLPPIAYLAAAIGGDRVNVISILPVGRTPHDYTPRTATLQQTAQSALFFTARQTFEDKIAAFIKDKKRICDVTGGIKRIHFSDGGAAHRHCDDHACSNHDDEDPHVWLSAVNAAIIAQNITDALTQTDPDNTAFYQNNCRKLLAQLEQLHSETADKLRGFAGRTFFVYHPAFGYFAKDYQLKQRAVELNGREAGAAQLAAIIKEARDARANTVFVQKQFNPRTARALADQIGGTVEFLDPLAYDLPDNLRRSADAIVRGFAGEKR